MITVQIYPPQLFEDDTPLYGGEWECILHDFNKEDDPETFGYGQSYRLAFEDAKRIRKCSTCKGHGVIYIDGDEVFVCECSRYNGLRKP